MITLRPATLADADYLRRLRNDPEARKNFFHGAPVGKQAHMKWLRGTVRSRNRRVYVAEASLPTGNLVSNIVPGRAGPLINPEILNASVGTGRLDFNGETVELSLNVDPDHRGQGFGNEIVAALTQAAREWKPGVPLIAHVKAFNTASLRAFLRAGFAVKGKRCLNLEAR